MKKLTHEDFHALLCIETGADVFDIVLANTLRAIERKAPELIMITQPHGHYTVRDRHPYFGARCTALGEKAIRNYSRRRK